MLPELFDIRIGKYKQVLLLLNYLFHTIRVQIIVIICKHINKFVGCYSSGSGGCSEQAQKRAEICASYM